MSVVISPLSVGSLERHYLFSRASEERGETCHLNRETTIFYDSLSMSLSPTTGHDERQDRWAALPQRWLRVARVRVAGQYNVALRMPGEQTSTVE